MTMGHRLRSGSARRGLASISAAVLLTSMMVAPAFAEHTENTTHLEASDAVDAAITWSELTFDEADHVIVGRDDVFADNLTSGVLQGTDSPLLLTDSDELSDATAVEIERLGATTATILGGEAAISDDVKTALEDMDLTVDRIGGATRVETSVAVATDGAEDADSIIVARAFKSESSSDETQAFADSLAAGAWAAESGMPVLLTTTSTLHEAVETYIEANDEIVNAFIVGGTSAVSAAVQSELEALGLEVERVSGATRFETAVEVAEARGYETAEDAEGAVIIEGQAEDGWPGGFASAAYSAIHASPVILTNGEDLPEPSEEWLSSADTASLQNHVPPGGFDIVCDGAVTVEACAAAAEAAGLEPAPHTNETLAVTPEDDAVNSVSTVGENEGAREYEVSGLDDEQEYNIFLFRSEDLETDEDGNVTFDDADGADEEGNDEADWTATDADIETVNGLATGDTNGSVLEVSPQNGVITFVVDSIAADEIVPVVISNEDDDALDADPDLDLDESNAPTEDFGTGGEKKWLPDEADAGAASGTDAEITEVNQDENFFVADGVLYEYDDNDDFFVSEGDDDTCIPVSMTTFERELSEGDETSDAATFVYSQDEDASSAICIDDLTPEDPTNVTATANGSDVTVEWDEAAEADGYNIYSAEDPTPLDACPEDGGTADIDEDDYTLVGSVDEETDEFTDEDVADGTYCYTVTTVLGEEETDPEAAAGTVDQVETPVDDTTAPDAVTNASTVETDDGFDDVADNGDVFLLHFDENVVLGDNPALMVDDGTDADTIDESNATFEVDGETLIVTLTDTLEDADGDTLALPLTITNSRDIEDAAGNRATITDDTLEDDGPEIFSDTCDVGELTCTIVFNEEVDETTAETEANYNYDADGDGTDEADPTSATLGADGRTVTLVLPVAIAAGADIDPANIEDTEGDVTSQGDYQAA